MPQYEIVLTRTEYFSQAFRIEADNPEEDSQNNDEEVLSDNFEEFEHGYDICQDCLLCNNCQCYNFQKKIFIWLEGLEIEKWGNRVK